MGLFINPPGVVSKEEFLEREAVQFEGPPVRHRRGDDIVVTLVQNPGFSAAAVAFSEVELKRMLLPHDTRPKRFYLLPVAALVDVCPTELLSQYMPEDFPA